MLSNFSAMVVWAAPTVMRSVSGVLLSKHSTVRPQPVSVNLIFIFILAAFRLLHISLLSHEMPSVSMGHPFFSTLGSKSSPPTNLFECPICMTTLVIRSVIMPCCHLLHYHLLSFMLFMSSWVVFSNRQKAPQEHGKPPHRSLIIPQSQARCFNPLYT